MLTDLLRAGGVPFTDDYFTLDGTAYSINPQHIILGNPVPTLIASYQSRFIFILAAWSAGGRPVAFQVEFGFVGPSDDLKLVMLYRDLRTPSQRNGTPLTGLINTAESTRIINRWKATELLK